MFFTISADQFTERMLHYPSSEWGGPVYPPGHPEAGQSIPRPVEVDSATKAIIMIASFVPGVGEVIDAIDIASAVKDGNYDEAAFILAIMALPGSAKGLREGGSGAVRAIKGVDDDTARAIIKVIDGLGNSNIFDQVVDNSFVDTDDESAEKSLIC